MENVFDRLFEFTFRCLTYKVVSLFIFLLQQRNRDVSRLTPLLHGSPLLFYKYNIYNSFAYR